MKHPTSSCCRLGKRQLAVLAAVAIGIAGVTPKGQTLVSGSYDLTIKASNLRTGQLEYSLSGHAT
jgi:ethanolamine utilization microcompartment shell protein EutS